MRAVQTAVPTLAVTNIGSRLHAREQSKDRARTPACA
jgi:hypothetical protein